MNSESFILIVDDNPKNLQVLGNILRAQQYKTAVAKDGATTLKLVKKKLPDLILLDIMLPGMDGFEVCRQLKSEATTREIPVIFISALTDTAEKLKGFQAGGMDYIAKPFQKEEVLARVCVHLDLRHSHAELKRSHAELQNLNRQLEKSNATKDKFFSILAQDLQPPIFRLLELARFIPENIEHFDQNDLKETAQTLQISLEHFAELLKNLFTWSGIQRGTLRAHPESIDIYNIVQRNLSIFVPMAEEKHVLIRNTIAPETHAFADPDMVYAVVRNLISNALKFTFPGDTISISAVQAGNVLEVSVRDTGVGISQENLAKLFLIDVTWQTPGTAGEEGAGLGLVLCKKLVEQNGGSIRVESIIEEGTTFIFTLPKEGAFRDEILGGEERP